jgi:hypothetical protein
MENVKMAKKPPHPTYIMATGWLDNWRPSGRSQWSVLASRRWSTCSFHSSLARLVQTAFDPALEAELRLILITLVESLVIPQPGRLGPSEIAAFYHDFTLQLSPLPAEARSLIHQLVVDIVFALDDAYEGRPTQPSSDRVKANGDEKNDAMEVERGPKFTPIPSTPRIALSMFTRSLVVRSSSAI